MSSLYELNARIQQLEAALREIIDIPSSIIEPRHDDAGSHYGCTSCDHMKGTAEDALNNPPAQQRTPSQIVPGVYSAEQGRKNE